MSGNPLIVALDCSEDEALALARSLRGRVEWVKVGMTLFYSAGPSVVGRLRELGFDVFVDLKLHDIPHQVRGAAASIATLGAGMLTVHASGGADMMRAAVEGSRQAADAAGVRPPAVLAVTVLTSTDDAGLAQVGVVRSAAEQVVALAILARAAGVDGFVCSPREASLVRQAVGEDLLIVTPGVRPEGSEVGDQARSSTPRAALDCGATHLVVGRPITGAAVPAHAVDLILEELEGGAS
jgi:orotidine-5'-phosphate decarboxylase